MCEAQKRNEMQKPRPSLVLAVANTDGLIPICQVSSVIATLTHTIFETGKIIGIAPFLSLSVICRNLNSEEWPPGLRAT
jgi:hypothetical protein